MVYNPVLRRTHDRTHQTQGPGPAVGRHLVQALVRADRRGHGHVQLHDRRLGQRRRHLGNALRPGRGPAHAPHLRLHERLRHLHPVLVPGQVPQGPGPAGQQVGPGRRQDRPDAADAGELRRQSPPRASRRPTWSSSAGKYTGRTSTPRHFLSAKIMANYPQMDFHRIYFGEMLRVRGSDEFRKK